MVERCRGLSEEKGEPAPRGADVSEAGRRQVEQTLVGVSVYRAAHLDCLTRLTNECSPSHPPTPSAVLTVGTPNSSSLSSSGSLHHHPHGIDEQPELPRGQAEECTALGCRARIQMRPCGLQAHGRPL